MNQSKKYKRSELALNKFIELCSKNESKIILDVGCGHDFFHTGMLRNAGLTVETNDFFDSCDHIGPYTELKFDKQYDGIWTSHVLEHQLNVQEFLRKCHADLKEGGILAITVPPLKHSIVGGHLNLFNLGLLFYHLVVAGFDLSKDCYFGQYGYNISVVVKKKSITDFPSLNYDSGDINTLSKYFPIKVEERFDGDGMNIRGTL